MPSAAAALTRNADVHTVVHVYGEQLACSPNALHDAIAMAHQQIRGRCSPTSMSTIRSPPNPMRRTTVPVGTSCTSPMMAESRPAGCDRIASTRRRAFRARTIATSFPSFPGWPDRADRGPGSRTHLDLRAERKRCLIDTREALANSLRTLANPPRLASPRLASPRLASPRLASPRLAQAAKARARIQHGGRQARQRLAVAGDVALQDERAAGEHERSPRHGQVVDRTGDDRVPMSPPGKNKGSTP